MFFHYIHSLFLKCNSVSIDTRKIELNSLFVAIKGDHFDANIFTKEALEKGASYVLIDNESYYVDERTILVDDSLVALQELAKFHRDYLKIPIIAITGSNGKTTTKELINVVLSKKFKTKATIGNLNNHIGVPLTLLSFTSETEIGIVEMGANHKKEIEFLCDLAQPDYGYITNFGKAHLEGFGGVEGVIEGKSEMYEYISKNKKLVFINLCDAIQVEKTKFLHSFTFGLDKPEANVNITDISANPFVHLRYNGNPVQSNLIGFYNANNVSAAITIGEYFNVSTSEIKEAIEKYVPENNRSQIIRKGTNQIILDAYNANPSSMKVAIDNFLQLHNPRKILILGDMFELGEVSKQEHKLIIASLEQVNTVKCYFIGSIFYENKVERENFSFFENFESFSGSLFHNTFLNNSILIKGSRGMALERTLQYIT